MVSESLSMEIYIRGIGSIRKQEIEVAGFFVIDCLFKTWYDMV
jgi:hypothetical protein